MFKEQKSQFAPGARIQVRDAEWLVRRVDKTSTGGEQLSCVGISQLVKDKEAIFLTEIEPKIEVLKPEETVLVKDRSASFRASLLYMESLLRQTAPGDENLYIGHRAAMDLVPYQLEPALQALQQPRQRILIADAVGLGKTLEAGVLVSELIKRGKGSRILVAAVKSMLTQFQKEFWSRFTIPLTRLDSTGIQRIRSRIPTSHNPFYYYDKTIISIDTLKQDAQYRTYIENAYWDIIIIDEAQNVADRGSGAMRNKLARLLAKRSDTLIMLSATPHDGKAKSFASLMNMLDPTAIANPEDYSKEDIKGLFIRRFKKDIQDQVQKAFKEREISVARCNASPLEEDSFDQLTKLEFSTIDQRKTRPGSKLFKTTLEKQSSQARPRRFKPSLTAYPA
jgi:SNF2 family DNA or RNA helicase